MGLKKSLFKYAKKGFILSLFAMIMSTFIIFTFSSRIISLPEEKSATYENRIRSIDYQLENLFDYIETVGSISGYHAINGLITSMQTSRQYNPNFNDQFPFCAVYGNLTPTLICPNMNQKNLEFFLSNITTSTDLEMKTFTTFSINNISYIQDNDPFYLNLEFNITINISDRLVNISSTRIIISRISIEGFTDPIYMLNGTYNQTIKKHNVTKIAGTWNPIDLQQIYLYSTYRYSSIGVSFVNRIKGNFTPDSFGIESFVNHTRPELISRINENISMVDYLFWSNTSLNCNTQAVVHINPSAIPAIPAVPGFQLDDIHRVEFNISGSDVSPTC